MSGWFKRRSGDGPIAWEQWKQAPVSAALLVVAAVVSAGYIWSAPTTWEQVAAWGYLPGSAIWSGRIWPLWTTAFLHEGPIHLFFNLYWLWFFGRHLEPYLGSLRFAGLFLLATFVSSSAELAWSGETGIGLSGYVYALFGYAWLAPNEGESLKSLVSKDTRNLMIGWLFLCLVLTYEGSMKVANAAHFAGFGIGCLLGIGQRKYRPYAWGAAFFGWIASAVVLLWSPWSVDWLAYKADRAVQLGELGQASFYVERILKKEPSHEWALGAKKWLESAKAPAERK